MVIGRFVVSIRSSPTSTMFFVGPLCHPSVLFFIRHSCICPSSSSLSISRSVVAVAVFVARLSLSVLYHAAELAQHAAAKGAEKAALYSVQSACYFSAHAGRWLYFANSSCLRRGSGYTSPWRTRQRCRSRYRCRFRFPFTSAIAQVIDETETPLAAVAAERAADELSLIHI